MRLRVVFRGVGALVVLALFGVGLPVALTRFVGWPLPSDDFAFSGMIDTFRRTGIAEATVVKALALIVWFAWSRLIIGLVVETAGRIVHRPVRQVRMLGSGQRYAAHLVTAVVLMLTSLSGVRGAGASPLLSNSSVRPVPTTLIREVPDTLIRQVASGSETRSAPVGVRDRAHFTAVAAVRGPEHSGPATWAVQRNDSFWGIAEVTLGDGQRWREVVAANIGREVAPGVVFLETTEAIHPGWVLAVPTGAVPQFTSPPSEPGARPGERRVVVEPGDTLATLAADEFGSTDQWPAMWETNRGRVFAGDTFSDPNLIKPGWDLIVPDDPNASVPASEAAAPEVVDVDASVVEAAAVDDVIVPGTDVESTGVDPMDVDIAQPTSASLPPSPRSFTPVPPSSSSSPLSSSSSSSSSSAPSPLSGSSATANPSKGLNPFEGSASPTRCVPSGPALDASAAELATQRGGRVALVPAGIGGSLLAGGMLTLVASRRRRQLQQAPLGAVAPLLPADLIGVTRILAGLAAPERLARLDAALRAAASQLAERPERAAVVAAIVEATGAIELAVQPPTAEGPSAPFMASTDGGRWLISADVETAAIAPPERRFAAFPNPAIVHIGRSLGREVFVDIEAVGLLTIDGSHSDDVLRSVIAGLAVSPFAELARLVCLGGTGGAPSGRSEQVDSLDAALDFAVEAVAPILGRLGSGDTAAALRIRSSGEPWEPVVLAVSGSAVAPENAAALVEYSNQPSRGFGIVTDSTSVNGTWCLVETPSGWVLDPLGWSVEPVGMPMSAATALGQLVDHASLVLTTPVDPGTAGEQRAEIGDETAPERRRPLGGGSPDEASRKDAAPSGGSTPGQVVNVEPLGWEILIRVLGPVDAVNRDGAPADFEKSKSLELLTWLTEHRRTATRSGARAALWDNEVRDATFANVVSDARRTLGRLQPPAAGADEWVGRTLTEQLVLHPGVLSDVDIVREAIGRARQVDDRSAVDILRPAVELVRGVPFAGVGYLWADAEALGSNAALLAITASGELAERAVRLGDVDTALWATGRGLIALPGHEELIALRLRAHACRGDLVGLRQEWDQYERVLEADPWLASEPSESLIDLRNDLLAGLRHR